MFLMTPAMMMMKTTSKKRKPKESKKRSIREMEKKGKSKMKELATTTIQSQMAVSAMKQRPSTGQPSRQTPRQKRGCGMMRRICPSAHGARCVSRPEVRKTRAMPRRKRMRSVSTFGMDYASIGPREDDEDQRNFLIGRH